MIITCEECATKFNLDESLLKKDGSRVRCSQCRHIFTAYPLLLDSESEPMATAGVESQGQKNDDLEGPGDFDLENDELDFGGEDELNFEFEFDTSQESKPDSAPLESLEMEDFQLDPGFEESSEESGEKPGDAHELARLDDELEELSLEAFNDSTEPDKELDLMEDELEDELEDFDLDEIEASLRAEEESITPEEVLNGQEKNQRKMPAPDREREEESPPLSAPSQGESTENSDPADHHRFIDGTDDREMADWEPPGAFNGAEKTRKPGKVLLLLLILLLAALTGYSACILKGIEIPYITSLEIPYLTKYLQDRGERSVPVKLSPDKKSVKGRFVTNSPAGTLFVITGQVISNSVKPASHARVTGTLLTKGKVKAREKTVFCGNVIDEEKLKTLDMAKIEELLSNRDGKNSTNTNITMAQPVPFMIVFSDLPDNLENFTVTVAGFDKKNKNNS